MRILNTQYNLCMEGEEKHSHLNQLSLHFYFFEEQRPYFFIRKFKTIKYLFLLVIKKINPYLVFLDWSFPIHNFSKTSRSVYIVFIISTNIHYAC